MMTRGFRRDGWRMQGMILLGTSLLVAVLAGISSLNGGAGMVIEAAEIPVEIATAHRSDLVRSIAAPCAIVSFTRGGVLCLNTEFSAEYAGRIAPGVEAELTIPSSSGESWRGEISSLDAVTVQGPEALALTITLHGGGVPPPMMAPGVRGRIAVQTETSLALLVVPREALTRRDGQSFVFLCRGGRAVAHPVIAGLGNEAFAEILSGLREGDSVITIAQRPLVDGAKIRMLDDGIPPEDKYCRE